MKKISFLNDAIDLVIKGKKSETLRLNEEYQHGEVVILTKQDGEEIGYLKILEKSEVSYSDLTVHDAKNHAWSSLDELKEKLLQIYPELRTETLLKRYKFEFLKNP